MPRGDDTEEVWHIAGKLCLIFGVGIEATQQIYVDAARSLIAELDRYRSAPHG